MIQQTELPLTAKQARRLLGGISQETFTRYIREGIGGKKLNTENRDG